jgi:basic membrane lipoprotein Med (substrate-binding protein (PBP1-ABC) superfamily)
MKKLIFLAACLVALTSQPVLAQTGGADVVVVKVFENSSTASLRIAISHGEGKTEVTELKGGGYGKYIGSSAEVCQRIVRQLYQEGYTLKTTFGGDQGSMSTLIFIKGQ